MSEQNANRDTNRDQPAGPHTGGDCQLYAYWPEWVLYDRTNLWHCHRRRGGEHYQYLL